MIASFIMITLDGFFDGKTAWDIDWHNVDEEFNDFATRQLDDFDTLREVAGRLGEPTDSPPLAGPARLPQRQRAADVPARRNCE